jgi:hypothetical protein
VLAATAVALHLAGADQLRYYDTLGDPFTPAALAAAAATAAALALCVPSFRRWPSHA